MVERRKPGPSIAPLIYWARERESIRVRKAQGLIPWTQDPILSQYRFCNLRRRDDRVSRWLIDNVLGYSGASGSPPWGYLQFTALCRWINWPPTIKAIRAANLWPQRKIDFKMMGNFIEGYHSAGAKAWTGAYMVRAAPKRDYGPMSKGKFVCEIVVEQGMEAVRTELLAALARKQLKPVWEVLCSIHNWGSFMAGQVVTDWSYTPLLERAGDICSWAPMGPGSRRGYNRLLGLPLKSPAPTEEVWCAQLREWRKAIIAALGPEYVTLTLMDVQNALCETDKYLRVQNGEGRPRATYKPETAY